MIGTSTNAAEGWQRVTLSGFAQDAQSLNVDAGARHAALEKLAQLNERHDHVVVARFLGGLSVEEVAHVLGVTERTVKRALVLARIDRLDEAVPAFESARSILHRMAEADLSNTRACAGATEVSGEMGRALFEAGRLDTALPELTAYTQEMKRCMPEDSMIAGMREQLASGHHRRGRALMALARTEDATTEQIQQHTTEGCTALHRAARLYESLGDDGGRVPPELRRELEECGRPDGAG